MKSLNNPHHANLILGSAEKAESYLHSLFSLKGSPDYFVFKLDTFGVDDARELSVKAERKAFGDKKIFFIAPQKITLEAQNALLKTFEEPVADTYFFLAVRDKAVLLPTLLSRMQAIYLDNTEDTREAEKFYELGLKARMAFVKKFVDEERSLSPFLDKLLSYLRKAEASSASIEQVYKLRLRSDERGASPRLILEHLALCL